MTLQEKYNELQTQYAEASKAHFEAEQKIAYSGFGDMTDMPDYVQKKQDWYITHSNYWGFLSALKGKNFNPSDEYDPSILVN